MAALSEELAEEGDTINLDESDDILSSDDLDSLFDEEDDDALPDEPKGESTIGCSGPKMGLLKVLLIFTYLIDLKVVQRDSIMRGVK